MLQASINKSLQEKVQCQKTFLRKIAVLDPDFAKTLDLIEELEQELENSNDDFQRMNDIARKLEHDNETLKKQLKELKRIG